MLAQTNSFIACDTPFEKARAVIFGAPFDSTTSFRPGARFGPSAIRSESFGIETYSPYQDKDLTDLKVFDSGDLELSFGSPEAALADIEKHTEEILCAGKLPVMLGGEHLVTLGAFRAAAKKYNELYLLHFDAHCDLRDDYLGQRLSHACVIRRCHDITGDGKIFQFGIRSGDRQEFFFARDGHTRMFGTGIKGVSFEALPGALQSLKGKKVYLTIDLDVLDPAYFCGTGTPEAGGASFNELLDAIIKIGSSDADIIAADLNELSPHYDMSGASTAVACKLLRELLLAIV